MKARQTPDSASFQQPRVKVKCLRKARSETQLQTVDTLFIRETFNPRSPGQEASSLMKNGHSGQWMNKYVSDEKLPAQLGCKIYSHLKI